MEEIPSESASGEATDTVMEMDEEYRNDKGRDYAFGLFRM